jgi:hypothetical protein
MLSDRLIVVKDGCMLIVIRPVFEVVKEGRILRFVSGDRRFLVDIKITTRIEPPLQAGSFAKIAYLAIFKRSALFHVRFTPGFGRSWF